MVGTNAVGLELPPKFSRLHLVFNVSLLMPFISTDPLEIIHPSLQSEDLISDFVDWAAMTYVIDTMLESWYP